MHLSVDLHAGARGRACGGAALRPGHGYLHDQWWPISLSPPFYRQPSASSSSPSGCGCESVVALVWSSWSFVIVLAVAGGSGGTLGGRRRGGCGCPRCAFPGLSVSFEVLGISES
jgi:hypothetical protein